MSAASGNTAVVVRTQSADDLEAVFANVEAAMPYATRDRLEQDVACAQQPELMLVAEFGGRIVGSIWGSWDGRRGWAFRLVVVPDMRDHGIGSALMDELERRLAGLGCTRINLLVFEDNHGARRLYERLGYAQAPPIVLLHKELPGNP